jgi:hypothetical protein
MVLPQREGQGCWWVAVGCEVHTERCQVLPFKGFGGIKRGAAFWVGLPGHTAGTTAGLVLVCWLARPRALTQPFLCNQLARPKAWLGLAYFEMLVGPPEGMAQPFFVFVFVLFFLFLFFGFFWFDQGRGVQQTQGLLPSPASARRLRESPATAIVARLT